MFKKLIKYSLISTMILASLATPQLSSNAKGKHTVGHQIKSSHTMHMYNNAYKLGMNDSFNNNQIKKRYRYNLSFAKGFMKGSLDTNYDSRMINYDNYRDDGGRLTYNQLGLKYYHKVSVYGQYINKLTFYNALTSKDVKKIFRRSGISKKYYQEFKYSLNSGQYIPESKFAKNIVYQYRLHKRIYFPKSFTDDHKWLAGMELGKRNNKATKTTAANFKRYFLSKYKGKKSLPYQKQFKKHYKINKIDVIPDERIATTNKYYIYNRNNRKNSGITFILPNGQYIGQIPDDR